MTKKDYIHLAEVLKRERPEKLTETSAVTVSDAFMQWARDVQAIADALQADNGAFTRDRFLAACGMV